jgi:hypothetical protein
MASWRRPGSRPRWLAAFRAPVICRSDWLAAVGLIATTCWLFRNHLRGAVTYVGDLDRAASSLNLLLVFVRGLHAGGLQAWSDSELHRS